MAVGACSAEVEHEARSVADPAVVAESALESAPTFCELADTSEPVALTVDLGAAGEARAMAVDAALTVEVTNARSLAGVATIRAHSLSHAAETSVTAATVDVPAGGSVAVAIPVSALSLTTAALDFSAMLWLRARIEYEDGTANAADEPVQIFYHPTPEGWLLYDSATRDAAFDGGALTPAAAAWRAEKLATVLPAGQRLGGVGRALVVHASDSTDFVPPPDGMSEEGTP